MDRLRLVNRNLAFQNGFVTSLAQLQAAYPDEVILKAYAAYHKKKPGKAWRFFCEEIDGYLPAEARPGVCPECGMERGHKYDCSHSITKREERTPFPEAPI